MLAQSHHHHPPPPDEPAYYHVETKSSALLVASLSLSRHFSPPLARAAPPDAPTSEHPLDCLNCRLKLAFHRPRRAHTREPGLIKQDLRARERDTCLSFTFLSEIRVTGAADTPTCVCPPLSLR